MFESKIIYLLNRLLEPYVEGIDEESLLVSNLLSGKVVLSGLTLKPSIVHYLGLPFHLTFGLIDRLDISIHLPLLSLSKRKLVIELNNVVMLLTATPENQWDSEAFRDEYLVQKVSTLAAESLAQVVTEIKGRGFIWRTVISLLENLELRINNVHVRIEDYTTNPKVAYAVGCVIKSAVFLTSADSASTPRDSQGFEAPFRRSFYNDNGLMSPGVIYRRIELEGVGVYIDRLDPLRPGMMQGSDAMQRGSVNRENPKSRHPFVAHDSIVDDGEEAAFVDALSYSGGATAAYGSGGGHHRGVHFAHVPNRDRLRYSAGGRGQLRKAFRIKGRRAGDRVRSRLLFARHSHDRVQNDHFGHQRPLKVLASNNSVFSCAVSRLMNYLSTGEHNAECDAVSRNGWQRIPGRGLRRSQRRYASVFTQNGSGNAKVAGHDSRSPVKRDPRVSQRIIRRLANYEAASTSENHHLSKSITCFGYGNTATGSSEHAWSDRRCTLRRLLCCDTSPSGHGSSIDPDAPFMSPVGYNLSSGSTWRILLSTFCDIRHPTEEQRHESFDMIRKSQERYARRHGRTGQSPAKECHEHVSTPSSGSVKKSDSLASVKSSVSGSEGTASEATGDDAGSECSSTPSRGPFGCFSNCGDAACTVSDGDSDVFDAGAYKAEKAAPLSYDETWHTLTSIGASAGEGASQQSDEVPDDDDVCMDPTEPPHSCQDGAASEAWTRYTFVINRDEDPSLKEFFLRSLEEITHNYILNPKECNGVLSFYFCLYPTPPFVAPRTCWSAWGTEHYFKLYKETMALAKNYLPRCSVFLQMEGLNITISKDQTDCLINLIYESILKYMSWQSGIVYTFENPRASPVDEIMYMEYWPQYLLLDQNSKNSELKEFIMDFEILHSMQVIRILRSRASEGLRNLIRSFGERHGYDCDVSECLTDVLLVNICNQYDREADGEDADIDDCSRLQARLKIVGGIYEIASKHAKSHIFLESLRKICQPAMSTFDVVVDVVLTNVRIVFTYDLEPNEESSSSAKAYVLSTKGAHVFIADVYGRDGCQVIETELLPFSILSFPFSLSSGDAESQSRKGCPCHHLDGPATVLFSCGEEVPVAEVMTEVEPELTGVAGGLEKLKALRRDFGLGAPRRADAADAVISDSNLYLGLSLNRYCKPNDADTRVLLHVNSDLFGHVRLLDEYMDCLRMLRHNKSLHDTLNPVLVGAEKKAFHLSHDRSGFYHELYQLIDLGIEYAKNLQQGAMPFPNVDFFIEQNHQCVFVVDVGSSGNRAPYFVCMESFAMASDITPRLIEPRDRDSPYDSHIARMSNLRVLCVNGDYSFLSDGGSRQMYMGVGAGVKLSDYLNRITCAKSAKVRDDPVISLSMSKFQSNFELIRIGCENEVFVKLKCSNSGSLNRGTAKIVITTDLGSTHVSLRECDLLALIDAYSEYVTLCNDSKEVLYPSKARDHLRTKASHERFGTASTDIPDVSPHTSDHHDEYVFDSRHDAVFRSIVSQKWNEVQEVIAHRALETSRMVQFEMKLDYLYFELRRLVRLDDGTINVSRPPGSHSGTFDFSATPTSPLRRTPSHLAARSPIVRPSKYGSREFNSADDMIIIPTEHANAYMSKGFSAGVDRSFTLKSFDGMYRDSSPKNAISRHAALSCVQSVLQRFGVTLPLLSCKLTGLGVKARCSSGVVDCLRAFVGSVEVEDQTNSVPLYLSTLFSAGDSTLFWRWLKVRREIHKVRSAMESYSDDLNASMRHLLLRSSRGAACSRTERDDPTLRRTLRHIDYYSVDFRHPLSHEYDEPQFFRLKETSSHICRAYQRVEQYLSCIMDCTRMTDKGVLRSESGRNVRLPFFMMASIDYDDSGRGKCKVDVSNTMVNIAWEVVDELMDFCMRLSKKMANIPQSSAPVAESNPARVNLETTVTVEQSNLNVLCDSAWVGYKNFVNFMWYKVLRDSFHSGDPGSGSCSRRCSIADLSEHRSHLLMNINEHMLQQRGMFPHSLGQGTNASISSEALVPHVKALSYDKRREHHLRLLPKEQLFTPMKRQSVATNVSSNTLMRWSFVHRLLHEVHRNAILSTPIYMRLSGRGSIHLSLSSGAREPSWLDGRPVSTMGGLGRGFTDNAKAPSHDYPSLTVFMRASGSNIFGVFSRHFSYRVLTPCGYALAALRKRAPPGEEFYRQQIDFLKFIRQHRQRDSKFFELLALSKQTLYDFNECVDSMFIDPCRLEVSGGVLLRPDSTSFGHREFPQSLCMTVSFETVRCSLSCVDILSFCSLAGLAGSCLSMHTSGDTVPSTAVAAEPAQSPASPVAAAPETPSNAKELVEDSSTGADEFHSCAPTSSEGDWVSVKSDAENQVDIRNPVERRSTGLRNSGSRASQASNTGFLERLLSGFSVGVKVAFNLVYLEVSSNYVNELRNIFTASLEDFEFLLWSNREKRQSVLSYAPSFASAQNVGVADGKDWVNAHFNESISLSEVYSSSINDNISLCFGAIQHILSQQISSEELHPHSERSDPSRLGFGVIEDPISHLSPSTSSAHPLLKFESHFCVTLDICKTSKREMVMEPVTVRFRGSKASMSSKTIASLSTSWINLNISLIGAECVFGFMRYISEMARLRIALVEQQQDDYHAFQPPVACRSDGDIVTTMMPISALKNASQLSLSASSHATLGLTNPSLPVWEISSAIAFRIENNLFRCARMLDLHACLLAAVRPMSSFKLEGDAASASPLACHGLAPSHDVVGRGGSSRREITRDQQSYLLNSLGQPIAVCLYVDSSFESSEDCTWRVVEDGDSCVLPVGHYGIILPFVVRIQLNNCVYEIPSSMLNLTQDEELILRLDVSRKYLRGRHQNRMAFLRTMRPDRSNTQMYRFGVSTACTRFLVSDFASSKHSGRLPTSHVSGGWRQRVLKRIRAMRRVPGVPLHLFEHEEFKYAYVMVKTQQSVGSLIRSNASATSHFSLQLSSTLWISNQSHENLVVFPSVSMDAANRVVPSSSLVWLSPNAPATTTLPLAKNTIESNKMMAVVKAVGNNLFKQLTHIQDSKQPIKRLVPAHVLRPLSTNEDASNRPQDFKLQHLLLRVYSYAQQRVSVPLSWTIEPSCTICVCLQDDFPLNVGGGEYAVHVNRADRLAFEFPEDMPPHFKGDVLLSSTSVQHLYDSFELPRIKTPIPDYTSRVHLGNVGPDDILATGLNTGFVQDLTVSLKGRDVIRTKSITRCATAVMGSPTANRTAGRRNSETLLANEAASDSSARVEANVGSSRNLSPAQLLSEHVNRHGSISSDTTPDAATGVPSAVVNVPSVPDIKTDGSESVSEGSNKITFSDGSDRRSAYAVTSKTFAHLAVASDVSSGSPSNGMLLRRRSRVEHVTSLRNHKFRSASVDHRPMFDVPEDTDLPPKAILSATLIEVTSSMRSSFGTTVGRSGIRHYEISLESCQVVENMMPFDVHILSPVTYDYLKAANPSEGDVAAEVPFYPVPIKASGRSQFSWYIKNGRFVLRELLSREFNLKVPTEAVSVSRLLFEAMQPKFADAFAALHDTTETEGSATTEEVTTCPLSRRLVVSIEVSKKPLDPVDERGGLVKRYLASSQLVCTIFADKWIVNWLEYPISLCRGDGRYKQTIAAQNCTLVSQELSSTSLQLAVRKNTLQKISNFENYPMRSKRRLFSLDRSSETHVMSSSFSLPDLAYSTCDFPATLECPKLHYLISTSMAPAPFYRTSVLEILPQTTVTNEFNHALWLREPDAPTMGGSIDENRSAGYYLVEPGETIEFHSQVKGELILEITGVDPRSVFASAGTPNSPEAASPFTIWSSGISLKPSAVVQLRYPASLQQFKKLTGRSNAPLLSPQSPQEDAHRAAASPSGVPRPLRYGLCEVEIRMHRGAKMVRFMKPAVAEWVLLNTTGVDLWVQQLGVPGYGEVLPAVGLATGALTERYAGLGVPFACYDPFKEHTLLCRFHLNMRAFRMLVGQHGKGNRRKNDPSVGNVRADNPDSLLGVLPLRHVLNRRAGRVARVKGALRVNLSRVESMRCSAVFHLRYSNTIISMRLIAQTCVVFGQKTLHFTAMRIPTRGLSRFQRIRPLQFLHLYSVLKDKLTVPHDMRYNRSGTLRLLSRAGGAIRRMMPAALCGDGQSSLLSFNASRIMRRVRACFTAKSERDAVNETVVTPTARTRTQRAGLFNWEYVLQVNILGLGAAICGGIAEELLYISSTLIKLQVMLDNDEHMLSLSVAWIQSDVHDSSTCYPTMLRPLATWHSPAHANEMKRRTRIREHLGTKHDAGDERQQTEPHVITIKFNTRGNHYLSVREITNCSIELEPLSLNLDTRVGQALLMLVDEYISVFGFSGATSDYFATANVGIFSNVDSWLRGFDVVSYPLREVARSQFSSSLSSGTRYNISNLHVGRIMLAINVRRSGSRATFDLQAQNVIIRYLMHIVRRMPHISDASIILAQESFLELCCTPYALMSHFSMRYITQSVQQIYKVLGAVDLIGNPKIVVHHWMNGCCQAISIMRESLEYLHLPPVVVFLWFRSVSRMGVSVVSGIADAVYRLTGSWYLIFNRLACNADRYAVILMQEAFSKSLDQPSNVMEGIVFGGRSVGRNLYVSVGNFALKPLHQLLRCMSAIKTAKAINGDVTMAFLHIFGSLFSSMASLIFGTFSSLLSGISVVSQGLLHQIHSAPMLSAIRPQRSHNYLKTSGPLRYNFLESWSMCASEQTTGVKELLLLLPLDGKLKLFDPMYTATSHWSALSAHMALISPITVCTPASALQTFFWINRTHVGLLHRRKTLWKCESKSICSIEIFRVPATCYQKPEGVRYEDSVSAIITAKAARKFFSASDTFYLRVVHISSESSPSIRRGPAAVPPPLLQRLQEEGTFPSDDCAPGRANGMHLGRTRAAGWDSGEHATAVRRPESGKGTARMTSARRLYQESVDSGSSEFAGITIDKYERRMQDLPMFKSSAELEHLSSQSSSSRNRIDEVDGTNGHWYETGLHGEPNSCTSSYERVARRSSARRVTLGSTAKMAKVVRLPNMETARLYFTLLVSVLHEATL